ncbi:hypothetical protein CVT25_005318 [Psilocybe cyanescens]|uniref:Uncharacterized protein n=1 Tax=Psilocybe cyanescens TaxID=93625 RepID=A0A409VPT5_PSICY|nr:hypothetical protein CVT25_005318 [Psilocybe cyanescens]
MHEFYDESIHGLESQEERLRAARVLSQAGIRCLIHGEDPLSFIYFVPTGLFELHVIVANKDVHRAVAEIHGSLPYRVFTGILDHFNDPLLFDPNRTRAYPNSIFLKPFSNDSRDPDMIIVHPESDFNLVVSDYSRSVPLPPFPDNIRFPTRVAFLDSAIETRLDPNSSLVTHRATQKLSIWISYIIAYTLRNRPIVLPNGDLDPEAEALKCSLRPENQPQFEANLRHTVNSRDRSHHMLIRREILRNMGNDYKKMRADRAHQQAQQQQQQSTISSRITTPSSCQR